MSKRDVQSAPTWLGANFEHREKRSAQTACDMDMVHWQTLGNSDINGFQGNLGATSERDEMSIVGQKQAFC